MLLIINLPELILAFLSSPCKILFGIVTKFVRLSNELLTPAFIGEGKILYAFATGSNKTPSKAWLNANVALLNFSKQSLTSAGWFF